SLAATITKPADASNRRAPAVIIVSTSGPQDRDATAFGVPVAGELAGLLAANGYFVVRYDGRGVGQSGGRTENAEIADYTDDAGRVIAWARHRDDVDADRVAVLAYAGAGVIALDAAAHDGTVKAVALVAAAGLSGRDQTLTEQQHLLSRMKLPDSEKAARIA